MTRLNRNLRERVNRLESYDTSITEGKRIHYNFVKPHQALDGKMPAQNIGLGIKEWKQLLQKSAAG